MLMKKSAFTFRDPATVCSSSLTLYILILLGLLTQRSGVYGNTIFVELISEQWFDPKKKSCEGFGDYGASFNPIPGPLIALVAAAVECVIMSYVDGRKASIKFTEHQFSKVYQRHIKNLSRFEKAQPVTYLKFCRDLWVSAWYVS